MQYEANWESIDSRPVPGWFGEAKFGIFLHWGLYSVPAWAPKGHYSEWYWENLAKGGEYWEFHKRTYGEEFRYQDFVPQFTCELFDADEWADLFVRSGARYIVPTSKHHDGFCLWPSAHSWNWNSWDVGPHRDLLGELLKAVDRRGLRPGFYYSLYEWYNPYFLTDPRVYVDLHMLPQMKEVIERYKPHILFTDGEWDHPSEVWRSTEFLAWLFNESSVKDEIVVNDRWGKETRSLHGGYFTTEYGEVGAGKQLKEGRPWEECRGIGASFGYSRREAPEEYLTSSQCIELLADVVSKGGNLLLNIGPTADGRIPEIMQERLLSIGRWLSENGEAIYGTRPWRVHGEESGIRYTAGQNAVFAICSLAPGHRAELRSIDASDATTVEILGRAAPVEWRREGSGIVVELPRETSALEGPVTLKLTGVA